MNFQEPIEKTMQHCMALGVDYADIRFKDIITEELRIENGAVQGIETKRSRGAGIRVYNGGAMGFAATNDMDRLTDTAKRAMQIAKSSAILQTERVTLGTKPAIKDNYATSIAIDPFAVPLEEKLSELVSCDGIMMSVYGIKKTMCCMEFRKEDVVFSDTDGSYITQSFCQSGAAISARAINESDMQARSFGNLLRAGYEAVRGLCLADNARRVAEEASALIDAPKCPSGLFDIILMPTQMQLQIHESIGHPTELDRVLGSEAAFAGASFVDTGFLRHDNPLRYGSEHITVVADATAPNGLGTFGYDDEGVKAQCVTLIERGVFTGYQTSRDNAVKIGCLSSGAGLSDGWSNLPIVRMTNVNLMPGNDTLDSLIAGIDYGFLLDCNKSWSIDDLRVNFQFACEIAHEIKDGRLTGNIFKDPIYSGKTSEFWNSCDGVGNSRAWEMRGVPNCGKGQPLQIIRVAHGSPPARFRRVKLGVGDA